MLPSAASSDHLPDDPALLKGIVRELLAAIEHERRRNDQLTHRLDLLLKRVYGPRADTLDPRQLLLFEAPLAEAPPALIALPAPEIIATPLKITTEKTNGHGRRKLPEKPALMVLTAPKRISRSRSLPMVPLTASGCVPELSASKY